MMDEQSASVGAYGVVGVLGVVGKVLWDRYVSRESRSYDALVGQMSDRLRGYEERLSKFERALDEERAKRWQVEAKAHALELYVVGLQSELKRHGIDVPEPPQAVRMGEFSAGVES